MNPTAVLPTPMTEKDYRKRLLKIWFFGFLGLFVIIGGLNLWKLFRLTRDGVPISLIIRAVDSDRRQTLHYARTLTEPRAEDPICILKHAILQTDHNELTPLEARLDQPTDILCVAEVERGIDLVEDVHWCRFELQERHD